MEHTHHLAMLWSDFLHLRMIWGKARPLPSPHHIHIQHPAVVHAQRSPGPVERRTSFFSVPNIRHSGWLPMHAASPKICLWDISPTFPIFPSLPAFPEPET